MWLLPGLSRLASALVGSYYRFEVSGSRVPRSGPVLLVANHPNSLIDAGAVAIAARRPVRFLARAPLFESKSMGWFIRAVGSIPVYRSVDRPGEMGRNLRMFEAVHEALAEGAAVGIFPEGVTHSEPQITPLKTGAARIALGAARRIGEPFPIVPVGLTFRDIAQFQSEALARVGRPIPWSDLAGRTSDDAEAVRELTSRIDLGIRRVTVNLERWEDLPIVETAEAILSVEEGWGAEHSVRMRRRRAIGTAMIRARRHDPERVEALAREITRHREVLDLAGLDPGDLGQVPGLLRALGWALRRVLFFGVAAPLAVLGAIIFFPPYFLTAHLEKRQRPEYTAKATFRVMVGGLFFVLWTTGWAALSWWQLGWRWAIAVLTIFPTLGFTALAVRKRWDAAYASARRYLLLRGREDVRRRLRRRQRQLARRIKALRRPSPDGG